MTENLSVVFNVEEKKISKPRDHISSSFAVAVAAKIVSKTAIS